MIYSFLKGFTRLALSTYFRKIHISGEENLPKNGPFLIVANHPSSFLDPVSIAVLVKQKISFLAGGFMFKNKIVAGILTRLNMVPIYRAQDDPTQLNKNQEVFSACYKKLSDNGVIMIFPEGTSDTERRLRKIKTGAARIALGTAKENDYKLNVKIVPVGLNYTQSSKFRSELFLQFGTPLESDNFIEDFKKDEITTAKNLTAEIEKSIKNLIINIDQGEYDILVERVESLYKPKLLKIASEENSDSFDDIKISQNIYKAIKHFQEKDSVLFHQMKTKIDNYFLNLEMMSLTDKSIEKGAQLNNILPYTIQSVFILILGFPIWVFGYLNSFIPYRAPRYIAKKITDSEAFLGALLMSLGALTFVIFYSLIIYLTWVIFHSPVFTLCYGIVLILSSFFTIFYARIARRFYYNWQFISRFFSKQKLLVQLMSDRNNIIKELEIIKTDFNNSI